MKKKIILTLLVPVSLFLFNSCLIFVTEEKRVDARMEQIISAIKDKDRETIKTLFSKRALNEVSDFASEIAYLFDFIQGDIESWERYSWASDGEIDHGKKTLMIRFGINIKTNEDDYRIYVMDYNMDTINPDNEGVYMMEVSRTSYKGTYLGWQERMSAGIYILE